MHEASALLFRAADSGGMGGLDVSASGPPSAAVSGLLPAKVQFAAGWFPFPEGCLILGRFGEGNGFETQIDVALNPCPPSTMTVSRCIHRAAGLLGSHLWIALSFLHRRCSGIPARAGRFVPQRAGARAIRHFAGNPERSTVFGLSHNRAFLTATLGMAAMTFSLGGIQVWMPQFLYSERHYSLQSANFIFGVIIVVDGILASLAGGWLGDYLLRRMKSSYYLVSAVSMALGVPFMIVALFTSGPAMLPAIAVAAFFLLLNTSPLNAAVINSVDAHIRATAIAANIFIIHILGDVPSPTMMGWVADHRSLQIAFVLPVIAMVGSSAILFVGMKYAPTVRR
jgi:hypothetical protein